MNKLFDIALGWPGVVVFCVLVAFFFSLDEHVDTRRIECEAKGGKMVQTIKLYRECRIVPASK